MFSGFGGVPAGFGFPAAPAQPAPVSFRAGRCTLEAKPDGKFLVSADLTRGLIAISKDAFGVKFKWTNTVANVVVVDRVFPLGSAAPTLKKVKTGRDGDRVYWLKLPGSDSEKLLFWLQSMDTTRDEESIKKANDLLALVATAAPAPQAAAPLAGAVPQGGALGLDLSSLLATLGSQTNRAAPGVTPARPAMGAVSTPATTAGGLTVEDLRRAMQGTPAAAPQQPLIPQTPAPARRLPDLQNIVTGEEVVSSGVLDDPQVQQELLQHLPEGQQTVADLHATIRSAQLAQSLGSLSDAVQQGDAFAQIAANLSLDASASNEALARGDGVGALLAAVQATHPPQTPQQGSASENTPHTPAPHNDNTHDDSKMDEE